MDRYNKTGLEIWAALQNISQSDGRTKNINYVKQCYLCLSFKLQSMLEIHIW